MQRAVTASILRGLQILTLLALIMTVTWFAYVRLGSPMSGIDDANIFFVYARSVSVGDGFVFNAGSERVEGFTSLLWVMICSAGAALSGAPERYLLALNILLVALGLTCCLRCFVVRTATGTSVPWAAAFLVLLLLDFRYITWNTLTLMETALWMCLLTLAAVHVAEGRSGATSTRRLAVLVTLLVLTRPEALVWVPLLCGLFYISHAADGNRREALAAVVPALIAFILTTALLTLFRLAYFGVPLPNTYYAKVSPSLLFRLHEGARYLKGYLLSGPVTLSCGVAVLFSLAHLVKVRFREFRTLALTVLALAGLGIPVLTGGDHFDGFRFYQSVYPLLLLVLLNFARFVVPAYAPVLPATFPRSFELASAAALFAVLLTFQIVQWMRFDTRSLQTEFDIAAAGRRQGQRLNALFDAVHPLPDIGTIAVGGLRYAYRGPVIDLMGLNDTRMAHNGGNRVGYRSHAAFETRTFYELKPTIVMPLVRYSLELRSAEQRASFVDYALKGLLQEARFRDAYRLAEVRKRTTGSTTTLAAWYDRKFLSDLAQSGKFDITFGDDSDRQ